MTRMQPIVLAIAAALLAGCESVPEPTLIAGHVVDTTREPVAGVTVTYSPMFRGAPSITDDAGAFELEVPAAIVFKPQFKVLFDRPGFPLMSHKGSDLPEPVLLSAPRIGDEEPTDDETPADERPADETPADETPADETPADETPADETPADETPADETPADETPADGGNE